MKSRLLEKYSGTYQLQPGLINSYPCWTNKSKTNSIWFDEETGQWKVGQTAEISSRNSAIIASTGDDDWPQNLSSGWKYSHETFTWLDAGTDVSFEAISISKLTKV